MSKNKRITHTELKYEIKKKRHQIYANEYDLKSIS